MAFLEPYSVGDSVPKRKPAPEPLLAALAQLDAPSDNAVMVGDSHNDVAAARRVYGVDRRELRVLPGRGGELKRRPGYRRLFRPPRRHTRIIVIDRFEL